VRGVTSGLERDQTETMAAEGGESAARPLRTLGTWVLAVVAVAAVLLLVTALVPQVRKLAESMAKDEFPSLGRIGIVVAGLLAPIAFVLKAIAEWFTGLFGFGGKGHKDDELEKRTNELEAQLNKLRGEVAALDQQRQRELDAEKARSAELERQLADEKQQLSGVDKAIADREERMAHPPPPTDAEIEAARNQIREHGTFVDIFAQPRS
jgi:TolA-binding protein